MKKLMFACLAVGLMMSTAGCSKEKRIERRLERKDGKWDIQTMKYEYYADGALEDAATYTNAGSFVFDDDGTVIYNYNYDGDSGSQLGTWSNTQDDITMIFDGYPITMQIKDESKKEMTLEWSEEDSAFNDKEVYTYTLKR